MKLPVFRAIGMTFAFVFGHLVEVIKITWLPLALMMAGIYWAELRMLPMLDIAPHFDPHDPQASLRAMLPLLQAEGIMFLAMLIFVPMLYAGLLRFVIRGEKPRLPFYLAFGGDELRILITFILVVLLLAIIYVAGFVGILILSGLPALSGPAGAIAILAASCLLLWLLLWLALRLSLSCAGAIGARKIGIGPSWSTTKGAVWALFFYYLIFFVLFIAAELVLGYVLLPEYFTGVGQLIAVIAQHPHDPQAVVEASRQFSAQIREALQSKLPLLIGVGFAFSLIVYPLMIVLSGVAWRLLTEGSADKSEASPSAV